MIGLAGSHRTGKTTLARAYARQKEISFVETTSSDVFKRMGYDPQADYDFKTRIEIQNEILTNTEAAYKAHTSPFITDRTPVDFIAYLLADVQRTNLTEHETHLFKNYYQRCIESINSYFALVIVLQPGIPLVNDITKGPINTAYMEHINTLAMGIITDSRIQVGRYYIKRENLDIEERIRSVEFSVKRVIQNHMIQREELGMVSH
jgi:hypothetical protein